MNIFSFKRDQLNLEKFIQTAENLKKSYFIQDRKNIVEEDKNKKAYSKQESKYNLKQILKNYNLNRIGNKNGFTKEYITLLTDLLYENNSKNYSAKRLCLVDFRKKIIKKKISLSFQNFIENGSLTERTHNRIYLTNEDQKFLNLKYKNKTLSNLNNKINKLQNSRSKKKLSNSTSIDFLKKINLKIYVDSNSSSKNIKKNTISEFNFPEYPPINKKHKIKSKTIEAYTYKKTDDENKKYLWNNSPKEEYLEKNNRTKFIHYLNSKYDFCKYETIFNKKSIKEIYKRQSLFNHEIIKINKKVDFPFKKEFFSRFNRLKFKNFNK